MNQYLGLERRGWVNKFIFNNLKLVNAFLNTRHSLETKKKGEGCIIYHNKVISLIYKELFNGSKKKPNDQEKWAYGMNKEFHTKIQMGKKIQRYTVIYKEMLI